MLSSAGAGGCFCAWLALLPLLLLLLLPPPPPPLVLTLSPSWFLCQASLWPSALTPPLLAALGAPPVADSYLEGLFARGVADAEKFLDKL